MSKQSMIPLIRSMNRSIDLVAVAVVSTMELEKRKEALDRVVAISNRVADLLQPEESAGETLLALCGILGTFSSNLSDKMTETEAMEGGADDLRSGPSTH